MLHTLRLASTATSLTLSAFIGSSAYGIVFVEFSQEGANVVASVSGSAKIEGLSGSSEYDDSAHVIANMGTFQVGNGSLQIYRNLTSAPVIFGPGTGSREDADSSSGDPFSLSYFLFGFDHICFPVGYTSGNTITGTSTWDSTTIAALGLTPGTYEWTWGSGDNADSLQLTIVPEPSTYSALLGVFALGFIALRRRRK